MKSIKREIIIEKTTLLIKGVLAGICIGIAGSIYLALGMDYFGAFLFGFGLLVIVARGYYLYTGKVGYIVDNKVSYLLDIVIMIIGNFIGTFIIAMLIRIANLESVLTNANNLVTVKLAHQPLETFVLAIFCGMLMFIAVDGYGKIKNDIAKVLIVFFAVAIFIIEKFEHSIADMFYFSVSFRWSFKSFIYFLIMLLGNGVGAAFLAFLEKVIRKLDAKNKLKKNVEKEESEE